MDGIFVTSTIASALVVSIYTYFDFTQKPAFIRKYKINPHTNEPPDFKMLIKVCYNKVVWSVSLKFKMGRGFYGQKYLHHAHAINNI